jgi:hypothetical protein
MVCSFGYLFSSLLLNYADLLLKARTQSEEASIYSKINKLLSGVFIIALFINYWADSEYSQ